MWCASAGYMSVANIICYILNHITRKDDPIRSLVFPFTVDSEIFERILFSRIALKDIELCKKFATKARFTYINKRQSDFAISRGFYFHETSHMRSFGKIKSSRKFPNLQYLDASCRFLSILA